MQKRYAEARVRRIRRTHLATLTISAGDAPYRTPWPKSTVFKVWKMIMRSRPMDIFLM